MQIQCYYQKQAEKKTGFSHRISCGCIVTLQSHNQFNVTSYDKGGNQEELTHLSTNTKKNQQLSVIS